MRVLHLSPGRIFGGVETLQVTLARHRDLHPDMEQHFGMAFDGRLADSLRSLRVPVHVFGPIRIANPASLLNGSRRLLRLLRSEDFDLAICHMPWPLVVFGPALRLARVPILFWTHTATEGRHWLERLASIYNPDFALSPSEYTGATLSNMFRNVPRRTIRYPVELPRSFDRSETIALRNEFETSLYSTVIVQATRLDPLKGHLLHIRALALLPPELPWVGWIVGGSQSSREVDYLTSLKCEAERLGIFSRLRFVGLRRDVDRVLAAADIYCQPNISTEGLPIVFAEAMYAGLPVVTTRICGFWEAIDDLCGSLVDANDPARLAAVLEELVLDPERRIQMGFNGRRRAEEMFNVEDQIAKIYGTVREVVTACES